MTPPPSSNLPGPALTWPMSKEWFVHFERGRIRSAKCKIFTVWLSLGLGLEGLSHGNPISAGGGEW